MKSCGKRRMTHSWCRSLSVVLVALGLAADSGWATPQLDRLHAAPPTALGLVDSFGKVSFPTSCASRVQSQIEEGVALLHSFQYREARSTFAEVSKQDPHCAMAYWGKAMSLYQQLWGWPGARAFAKGHEDIETADKLTALTPRERAYIDVARLFYHALPDGGQDARMEAFSEGWERVYREFPKDTDAGAFYGLSLVALAEAGVDEAANRKKAIAVLDPLFRAAPNNPGPAHYLVHAADTPDLAPQGLDAALRYASIAPDSAHALHMPSHIFVRLGLWRESIKSNRASAKAAAEAAQIGFADIRYQVHAMDFLHYCYLQAGDKAAADEVTEDLENVVGAGAEQITNYQADFRARAALELHRWKDAESLAPAGQPRSQENTYWVRAIGAARNGKTTQALRDLQKLEEVVAALHEKSNDMATSMNDMAPSSNEDATHVQEALAWIAFAQGKVDEAVRTLRAAADHEKVQSLSMPAREMLADMLLLSKRAPEALYQYELALRESPNRFDSLYGAAHAAESADRPEATRKYFTQLLAASIPSADRPELHEAKTCLKAK
jgi:tetratricopeptide (TPR) repeat protein